MGNTDDRSNSNDSWGLGIVLGFMVGGILLTIGLLGEALNKIGAEFYLLAIIFGVFASIPISLYMTTKGFTLSLERVNKAFLMVVMCAAMGPAMLIAIGNSLLLEGEHEKTVYALYAVCFFGVAGSCVSVMKKDNA